MKTRRLLIAGGTVVAILLPTVAAQTPPALSGQVI
jgi:hypothetical protein